MDSIDPQIRKHYEDLKVPVIYNPDQYSTDFTKCLRYIRSYVPGFLSIGRPSPASVPYQGQSSLTDLAENENPIDVIVLGGLGGRVDQALSQIHHLYETSQNSPSTSDPPHGDLYLVSEESITFVLHKGKNTILTPGGNALGTDSASEGTKKSPINTQTHPIVSLGSGLGQPETQKSQDSIKGLYSDNGSPRTYLGENVGIIPLSGPAVINTTGLEWDVQDWKTEFSGQMSTSNHIRANVVNIETSIPVVFTAELAEWLKSKANQR